MNAVNTELKELSVAQLLVSSDMQFQIPIYQRNYAWQKDEITALVQDVYDAWRKNSTSVYYIGTLVTHTIRKDEFEIIDGQQRLTTICLLLKVLNVNININKLTFRAREKSNRTMQLLAQFDREQWHNEKSIDADIKRGFNYTTDAVNDIVHKENNNETDEAVIKSFTQYLLDNVRIIHYRVPKDIDLNHYFEVMNSRGEQLEKHEIVKAQLMQQLSADKHKTQVFKDIWDACSQMNRYIQSVIPSPEDYFGNNLDEFRHISQQDIFCTNNTTDDSVIPNQRLTITEILSSFTQLSNKAEKEKADGFQPIIDFPNFLLIVLKITQIGKPDFDIGDFKLDDKELLNEFDAAHVDAEDFAHNLLKAKFLLDNFVVHHTIEDETEKTNPWKLQKLKKNNGEIYPVNIADDESIQNELVQLLSMFEVTFTARQRKNYLFYVLLYLIDKKQIDANQYLLFLRQLARCYFENIYLDKNKLTSRNTPSPRAFDDTVIKNGKFCVDILSLKSAGTFLDVFGDGTTITNGIPLFVFNYTDYCIWKLYAEKGRRIDNRENADKAEFIKMIGTDLSLDYFNNFYFSRTRRSLEHYYAQAYNPINEEPLTVEQRNCFGNFAMIGSEANSAGSNWSPHAKCERYIDPSRKISYISVASLKMLIMMQICKDNNKWNFNLISEHQQKMLEILFSI